MFFFKLDKRAKLDLRWTKQIKLLYMSKFDKKCTCADNELSSVDLTIIPSALTTTTPENKTILNISNTFSTGGWGQRDSVDKF